MPRTRKNPAYYKITLEPAPGSSTFSGGNIRVGYFWDAKEAKTAASAWATNQGLYLSNYQRWLSGLDDAGSVRNNAKELWLLGKLRVGRASDLEYLGSLAPKTKRNPKDKRPVRLERIDFGDIEHGTKVAVGTFSSPKEAQKMFGLFTYWVMSPWRDGEFLSTYDESTRTAYRLVPLSDLEYLGSLAPKARSNRSIRKTRSNPAAWRLYFMTHSKVDKSFEAGIFDSVEEAQEAARILSPGEFSDNWYESSAVKGGLRAFAYRGPFPYTVGIGTFFISPLSDLEYLASLAPKAKRNPTRRARRNPAWQLEFWPSDTSNAEVLEVFEDPAKALQKAKQFIAGKGTVLDYGTGWYKAPWGDGRFPAGTLFPTLSVSTVPQSGSFEMSYFRLVPIDELEYLASLAQPKT